MRTLSAILRDPLLPPSVRPAFSVRWPLSQLSFSSFSSSVQSAASTQSASGGKKSSLKASTANLCLGVLGAGQLTLPFAIRGAGLFLGSGILLLLASLAVYSLTLLTRCQQHTGANNYGGVLRKRARADLARIVFAWLQLRRRLLALSAELPSSRLP